MDQSEINQPANLQENKEQSSLDQQIETLLQQDTDADITVQELVLRGLPLFFQKMNEVTNDHTWTTTYQELKGFEAEQAEEGIRAGTAALHISSPLLKDRLNKGRSFFSVKSGEKTKSAAVGGSLVTSHYTSIEDDVRKVTPEGNFPSAQLLLYYIFLEGGLNETRREAMQDLLADTQNRGHLADFAARAARVQDVNTHIRYILGGRRAEKGISFLQGFNIPLSIEMARFTQALYPTDSTEALELWKALLYVKGNIYESVFGRNSTHELRTSMFQKIVDVMGETQEAERKKVFSEVGEKIMSNIKKAPEAFPTPTIKHITKLYETNTE